MQLKSERTGAKPLGDAKPLDEAGTFIPRKKYAAILGICPRSAVRRENGDPDFPLVFYINGRAYVTDVGLAAYQTILMRRGLSEGPPAGHADEPVAAEPTANPRKRGRPAKTAPLECEGV